MIIDSSVIIAMVLDEPERDAFELAIARAEVVRMSAASYLEASIKIDSPRDPILSRRLDDVISRLGIQVEAVSFEQARLARAAYRDYGKGHGHPARLNFGDCFAYALARETGEPLLFKGDDFTHTDIKPAV